MRKFRQTCRLTLALLCLSIGSWAQTSTGSLSGAVTDVNGAVVPEATVSVTDNSTGIRQQTVTTNAGLYVFATLPVSTYTMSVEKTGFKRVNRTNIEIRIAQRMDLNVELEVGDVQQTIDVSAEAPLLETSTSEKGQTFSPQFMNNLPLFQGAIRDPRQFVSYMPGVNAGFGETSISGSGGRAQEVQIDGASLIIPESGGTVFNMPSAEMFNEFKVITGAYSAEYGRFGGGMEIYVTKSGSNWYHGTAFLNMRRDIWNANAWQRNATGQIRPKERQNEVGGAMGGPVFIPKVYDGRNKTFWYMTYTKQLQPATISFPISTVPTALMRQGNFSELGNQTIYDPNTTVGTTRQPFAGNIIPQSRISNVARNLMGLIPDPTRAGLQSNYDFVNTSNVDRAIWSLKFDHAFTPNNRLAFFMSKEDQVTAQVNTFPGPIGQGLGSQSQKPYNYRGNHDLVITPNFLMHTTVGISATRQGWNNPAQQGFASRLGIPGVPSEGDAMPRIQFLGAAGLTPYGVQDGKVANGGQDNDTYSVSQGYSWLKGKHEFKFGWDYRYLTTFGYDYAGSNGLYVFNRLQTAMPNSTSGSGHEFASLLLGAVDSAQNTVLPIMLNDIRYRYSSAYFQDNFRVNSRLTLNLGFRYEVPIGWHVEQGNYSSFDLTKPNPGANNLPGAMAFYGYGPGRANTLRPFPTDWSNIGPRLGFAYRIGNNTVLRGGWGTFYQTLGNGGCGCREGFASTNQLLSNGIDPIMNWDAGIPVSPNYQPPPNLNPALRNFQDVDYLGENFGRAPRVHNWSFNIQHEVKGFLFDVGYLGNRGTRLNSSVNINQVSPNRLALGSLLTQNIYSQAAIDAGFNAPFDGYPNRSVAQTLRPIPQVLNIMSRNSGDGRTWYDALQAKVERRFGGFQMMASYTWSKSLANSHYRQIFGQQGQAGAQDSYNLDDMKSFLHFDQPHVFNVLWTYDLPFGKGKRFAGTLHPIANAFVAGWTISGAQRYYSGSLIQLTTPGNPLGSTLFSTMTKANRNGNVPIRTNIGYGSLDPNDPSALWFNAGAFSAAAPFTLGNAATFYSDFRQPMVAFENVSVSKRTILWNNEKNPVELQYRADAFNLFNRTRFGGINGVIGNPNFGRATGPQVGARAITMGLRLNF